MKRTWKYVVSLAGMVVLFLAFLMFQTPAVPALGTVKLTDVMMIVGGLMFIVPIYQDSVARKTADDAPNRVIWYTLPPVGIAVVCVGLLIPNAVGFFWAVPAGGSVLSGRMPADPAGVRLPDVRHQPGDTRG